MLVARIVDPQPGMIVLDCCAAPGGKTTHMAELMNDQGTIHAYDIHEHKKQLIDAQAKRLHLEVWMQESVMLVNYPMSMLSIHFDRILLDAPCSGLGVIRRKPDLKWAKSRKRHQRNSNNPIHDSQANSSSAEARRIAHI